MEHDDINYIYDQISKILKNDQKYSYKIMGGHIVACTNARQDIGRYFAKYPPLLDVAELGASLEHEGSGYEKETIEQIRYKMQQLLSMLPEIK
jgi:hypothetical protein